MSNVINLEAPNSNEDKMKSYEKNKQRIYKRLPEIKVLDELIVKLKKKGAVVDVLEWLPHKNMEFPLYSISIGSEDLTKPCLLVVGGVHGLERIGSKVTNSMLTSVSRFLAWDDFYQDKLQHYRMIFVPILNPVGMYRLSRSNGNNVDLMRNAPVDSIEKSQFFYGGHRMSPKLPFYRGEPGVLEPENKALLKLVREKVFPAKVSIALDIHSGFGAKDRIWFPYAKCKKPFPFLSEVHALSELFNQTYQNNVYVIEPQAKQYTTNGDVWDYFLDEFLKIKKDNIFMPLTLEMGSWAWIKKNPLQLFNPLGIFNPIMPHRQRRMMRRHKNLFDFLRRAVLSHNKWVTLDQEQKDLHARLAMATWYDDERPAG